MALLDLSSDLINKAKLAVNSQQKLFNLEQVKEIIFYRDTSLISFVIPELFDLMLERSISIRKFLVKIAGEALHFSISLVIHVLPLFSFLIVDGNDRVLQSIAFELSNYYDKISIFVANMIVKSTTSSSAAAAAFHNLTSNSTNKQETGPDPRDLWQQLRKMTLVLIEAISSNRSDSLRIQCIKLCENIVLYPYSSNFKLFIV